MNNLLNNASIKAKIIGNSLILLALIVFSSVYTLFAMNQIGSELEAIAEEDIPLTAILTSITEHQLEQTRSVVEQTNLAGSSLTTIAESVSKIDEMSSQIAIAAEEQSTVSENMNRNVVLINDMAKQNTIGAEQTSKAGHDLARMASELQGLVGQFSV